MGAQCTRCCLCNCFKICVCGERCRCPPLCRTLCECCQFADCCDDVEEEDNLPFAAEDENARNAEAKTTVVYANGDSYKGSVSNGKRHGFGELTLADGRKLRGQFQEDEFLGSDTSNTANITSEPQGTGRIGEQELVAMASIGTWK